MNIGEALEHVSKLTYAVRRESWKNERKALYIGMNGGLSVAYMNARGVMCESRYNLYMADIKATDWVIIPIIYTRGAIKLDSIAQHFKTR